MENTMKNILKGIGISIILTAILLLIFSIILSYTDVSESTIPPVIMVVTAISVLLGSSIGNIKIKKNGIVNGGIIGRKLYINIVSCVKYFKLEFCTKYAKHNNDSVRNNIWNIGWNYWSK